MAGIWILELRVTEDASSQFEHRAYPGNRFLGHRLILEPRRSRSQAEKGNDNKGNETPPSFPVQLEQLHSDSAGRTSDHERSVEQLTADYQKQIAELEERRDIEERQKHELALNLRSVEERSRSELAQLEAQKTQLELQSGAMQVPPIPIHIARRVLEMW
ncbi:unnamed protein product [Symbiodinium sp. CCMP2592]|nr:unnamed protein product [Symbiodinium sp. CCMP2592]